ncbi:SGNH/GDSL hydrolase family protein [Pseudozobellia thermophila]|uniref:Lysophospholipase L1 n=1 Tax=Pseudozobellia thermophila TaxID=192903 RepID=A0A1M6HXU4_9FLAO|nr:SGNH/GDSL hydrolase family protein [Pseudozobellia thermophila]SHJ26963.1 Lysophospholipase L1 [Pseudozobellia thermophila]
MKYILPFLLFFVSLLGTAQDPLRFKEQVDAIEKKYDALWDPSKETIVFTGSSSIRMWKDVQERFPNHQIINSGFGGSQASDLLYFLENLVLRYGPKKVFIYEGDNDISAKKRPNEIIDTTQEIIALVRAQNPSTQIVLISAKPSIARWKLKGKYKRLNRKFKRLSKKDSLLDYADVWTPMLDGRKLKRDIFIEDGLHMNTKGYDIWFKVMQAFVEN